MSTQSFGETELAHNSRTFGRVRILDVSAPPSVGLRLGIRLGFFLQDSIDQFTEKPLEGIDLRDLGGDLLLAEHGASVGLLTWAGPRRHVRSTTPGSESQIEIVLDLTPAQLESIEEHRDGGEPQFWLRLWPTFVSSQGYLNADIRPFSFAVPRDRWLRVLQQYHGRPIATIELLSPDAFYLDFKAASDHLAYAKERIISGHYDEGVGACRRAIEALAKALNTSHKAADLRKILEPATDAKRAEHYAAILARLKELAGLTIHRPGAPDVYSRAEARFILGTTTHTLALLGRLIPLPSKS